MRRYLILLIAIFTTVSLEAQLFKAKRYVNFPDEKGYLYRLTLKDKKDTPYKLTHPEKYLSSRAIERRNRQGLGIDSTDLPITPKYLKKISETGSHIISKSKWNNTVLVKVTDSSAVDRLKALSCVKSTQLLWITPDSIEMMDGRSKLSEAQSSPSITKYGVGEEQISMLNGIQLHDAGFRGRGMIIAIIDGGFNNVDSIPLFNNIHILGSKDFAYPRNGNVFAEAEHGTLVLSCMAGNRPEIFIGTAPDASYWLLRSEYTAYESRVEEDYWSAAVEFADSVGVDVINSSLGYHAFDDKALSYRYEDLDGKTALISRTASLLACKGIILCKSMGNDGVISWKKMNVTADAENILSVGAVSMNKENALFSAVGPTADWRVKPDVMAAGMPARVINSKGELSQSSGTSLASPVLCGMVACLWQTFPNKTAYEIMDLVRRSGDTVEHPNNIYGYGIPDFWKAYLIGLQQ